MTFQVYLTSASSSSTPVDYAVVVPGAGFFDASSLGGGLPSGELVISAGQTLGQFTINVPQGALGTRPSEDLAVAISTPDGNPIFAATAQVKVINDQPEPGNPAIPAFEVLTNLGTLTSSGNDYTLDLGALPKGSTPQIKVAVANSTAAPADELGGIFAVTSGGSAVTFSGIGQLVPIAAGRVYDGIQATVNTGALGANSATLAFTPQDLNESGYSALLSNLTLTIKYSTKLAAQAVLNSPTNIVFGNVRVGSEQKQAISVTNAAVAGAASLDASLSLNGAAAQFGTIYQLAPGATDATSLSVGLNTSAAGAASGFATLMLFSDGGSGTTEPLPSEQIEVFGRVFRLGATSISPIFAHVGDPTTKTLPITNTAAADGYSENIVASVIGTAGGVTGSGTTGQVVPQLTNSGIVLGYSTAAAGVVGGITIDIQSDGTNVDGLAPLDLGQQTLPVTINNYAQAAFEESFGGGTLTHSGNAYTLDLGTLVKGSGPVTVGLGARNSAAGPSDLLSGSFAISGSGPFTNSGFAAFAGVGAGQINNGPLVTIDTVSAGTFSETITLTPIGYNAGGYAGALAPETLTITGTVASGSTQFVSSGIVSSGVVVSNGNTLEVLAGGTANVTTVLSGGAGNVAGLVTSTNVVNGGTLNILPGRLEDSGVVASGGSELVSSGGVAGGHGFDTTILNGGAIYVLSGAHVGSSLVSGGGTEVVSFGGVAGRATIFGLQNVFGQTNSAILKSGGLQNVNSGASVTNTVFSGGTQSINSGAVVTGAIVGKGVQRVSSGGLASATTISSGGLMQVLFAGTAKAVGVQSGGTLELFGGAVTSQTTFASGAFLEIGSGYVASGIAASGGLILEVASGGTADATTVSSGGSLQILFSGAAINASIQSGGSEEVASGASASGDRVASGGSLQVDAGGVALGTIISGGMQTVLGGGLASGASISNGGVQAIASGGTASGTILSSGGQQNVASGGSAIGTVVGSGGIANVSAGGSVSGIVLNAASGFELLHGSATATQVSGGIEAVLGGGVATGASVGNTGIQYVGSGGLASGTTVLSGGQANVDVAGSAGGVTVSGGGVLLDAGSATSAVLMSGAAGYVRSAGTAFATLVLAGAADIVSSGGVASGSVLSGGVEAVFGGATVGTNVERNSVEYVGSGGRERRRRFTARPGTMSPPAAWRAAPSLGPAVF